ncbi:MAG: chemotaxis protein [Pseudomonadota bacterium]
MADNFLTQEQHVLFEAPGHDVASLGPSNSSDTGSDVQGVLTDEDDGNAMLLAGEFGVQPVSELPELQSSDTDGDGTGERRSAIGTESGPEAFDISPDRIIQVSDMGEEIDEDESEEEAS